MYNLEMVVVFRSESLLNVCTSLHYSLPLWLDLDGQNGSKGVPKGVSNYASPSLISSGS